MSPSASSRRQPNRPSRPSRGRSRPPQRLASLTPAIRAALVVTIVWSIVTGSYFAFCGEVADPVTEMRAAYEDRIADLRAQVDQLLRTQSRDQEQIKTLLQRQAALEQQASALTHDQSATGSIDSKAPAPDSGNIIGINGPVVENPGAPAVSTSRSASVRHLQGARANRRPGGQVRKPVGDQDAPAATHVDLGKPSFMPE